MRRTAAMARRALERLASLRLTAPAIAALTLGVLVAYRSEDAGSAWVVVPLAVLVTNLLAAILCAPQFRASGGLLVFHLCLLAVLALAAWGHLTRFSARVEITEGQAFSAERVTAVRAGPLHRRAGLAAIAFRQGPLRIDYAGRWLRGATRSALSAGTAGPRRLEVGDNRPLRLAGYRFYTTSNKGFAALLSWQDAAGARQSGAVNFPSYPLYDWKQINRWTTPGGVELTLELHLREAPPDGAWTLASGRSAGTLEIGRAGHDGVRLRAGESLALPGGVLRFDGLRLWMGYRIDHQVVLPWILAAALVGVLGLAWHYWRRLRARPLATRPAARVRARA